MKGTNSRLPLDNQAQAQGRGKSEEGVHREESNIVQGEGFVD